MKILILYASKTKATEECAKELASRLENCTVQELSKPLPALSEYDTIIIGSGVRIGKLYRPVQRLLRKEQEQLCTKRLAFFLCNAVPESFDKTVEQNIPATLRNAAVCIRSFGGKPPFKADTPTGSWRDDGAIAEFVRLLKGE